jgi:hypothetical protein
MPALPRRACHSGDFARPPTDARADRLTGTNCCRRGADARSTQPTATLVAIGVAHRGGAVSRPLSGPPDGGGSDRVRCHTPMSPRCHPECHRRRSGRSTALVDDGAGYDCRTVPAAGAGAVRMSPFTGSVSPRLGVTDC